MEGNLGAAYQLYLNSMNTITHHLRVLMNGLNQITTLQMRRKLTFQVAQVCKQKEQFQVQRIVQFQGHQ